MSDHKARELEHDTAPKHPKGRKETFAERDPLAAEEPTVLESSADDPEFPAMQEFEVDEGGPKANTRKHPGSYGRSSPSWRSSRSASLSPPPATG